MALGKMHRASKDSKEGDLSIAIWISVLLFSLGLGYSLYFADATRALARAHGMVAALRDGA